jgi:hypothetical protein
MKKRYFAQNDVLTAILRDPVLKDWISGLWKEIEHVPGSTP